MIDKTESDTAISNPTPAVLAAFAGWRKAWESAEDLLDKEDDEIESIGPHDDAMMAAEPETVADMWLQIVVALAGHVALTDPAPAGTLLRRALVEVERITGEPLRGVSVAA